MRMRIIPCLLFIAGCFISSIKSELFRSGGGGGEQQHPMDNALERDILDKTVDLISKRAYYYATSGPGKRLPNYDFGLGKRSKWVEGRKLILNFPTNRFFNNNPAWPVTLTRCCDCPSWEVNMLNMPSCCLFRQHVFQAFYPKILEKERKVRVIYIWSFISNLLTPFLYFHRPPLSQTLQLWPRKTGRGVDGGGIRQLWRIPVSIRLHGWSTAAAATGQWVEWMGIIEINYHLIVLQPISGIKRSRPYRFGLGKRDSKEPQRRSSNSRYNFGLGKR